MMPAGSVVCICSTKAREYGTIRAPPPHLSAWRWRLVPLLLFNALPHLVDGQSAAELALVIPLVALDLPLERLRFSFDQVEVTTDPIFRGLLIHLALERVSPARGPRHRPVLFVSGPHELRWGDVFERRGPCRKLGLLTAVLGGNQLPGADQRVTGFRVRFGFRRSGSCSRNGQCDDD